MNRIEKIKSNVEWILSLVFKLRLRKTYWSIAVPLGIVILGEIANKLEFIVKATYKPLEALLMKYIWLYIFLEFALKFI